MYYKEKERGISFYFYIHILQLKETSERET